MSSPRLCTLKESHSCLGGNPKFASSISCTPCRLLLFPLFFPPLPFPNTLYVDFKRIILVYGPERARPSFGFRSLFVPFFPPFDLSFLGGLTLHFFFLLVLFASHFRCPLFLLCHLLYGSDIYFFLFLATFFPVTLCHHQEQSAFLIDLFGPAPLFSSLVFSFLFFAGESYVFSSTLFFLPRFFIFLSPIHVNPAGPPPMSSPLALLGCPFPPPISNSIELFLTRFLVPTHLFPPFIPLLLLYHFGHRAPFSFSPTHSIF